MRTGSSRKKIVACCGVLVIQTSPPTHTHYHNPKKKPAETKKKVDPELTYFHGKQVCYWRLLFVFPPLESSPTDHVSRLQFTLKTTCFIYVLVYRRDTCQCPEINPNPTHNTASQKTDCRSHQVEFGWAFLDHVGEQIYIPLRARARTR